MCPPANSAGIERTPEENFLWLWVTDRKGGESESVTQIRQEFTLSAPFPLGLKEMRFQSAIIISFLDKSILPRAEQSHQEHLMTMIGIFLVLPFEFSGLGNSKISYIGAFPTYNSSWFTNIHGYIDH